MPKLSELLQTSQDTNPMPDDAIPTLKEVGGEATNKMAQLKDLPVSTAQAAADALKVNKAGDTMTGNLAISMANAAVILSNPSAHTYQVISGGSAFGIWRSTSSVTPFRIVNTAPQSALEVLDDGLNISGTRIIKGTGFPQGVVSAPVGSTYIDTNATNGAIEWKKATGSGNTGWVVSVGDTGWRNVSSLLANGWTGSLYVKRTTSGLSIHIEAASPSAATTATVAILPSGFTPSTVSGVGINRNFVSTATGPATMYRVTVNNAGSIIIQNFSTSMGVIYGTMYMSIADAWPSTLPGVSA